MSIKIVEFEETKKKLFY